MSAPDFTCAQWRKSSYSNGSGNCVEVARIEPATGVRDSKNPTGPALAFASRSWASFVSGASSRG